MVENTEVAPGVADDERAPGDRFLRDVLAKIEREWTKAADAHAGENRRLALAAKKKGLPFKPLATTHKNRHSNAWGMPHSAGDRMFKATIIALVTTSDAIAGPAGDYLMRPHLLAMYHVARMQLNYLDEIDGGEADGLIRALAKADGLDPDNVPHE